MSSTRKRLLTILGILNTGNYHELKTELDGLLADNQGVRSYDALVQAVAEKAYDHAVMLIQDLLQVFQPPVLAEDITISGLKTALALLETRLSVMNHRRVELHRQINEFRFRHNKELGTLMAEIFELRKELLFIELKENAGLHQEFEAAEEDFQQFKKEQESQSQQTIIEISKPDKLVLTALYRKASKMCHPDLIAEELRQEATLLFIRLNKAYLQNDLEELKRVLAMLEEGSIRLANRSEILHEKDRLTAGIVRLESELVSLQREIAIIEESQVYITIRSETDLDAYFSLLKEKFEKERDQLKFRYESRK